MCPCTCAAQQQTHICWCAAHVQAHIDPCSCPAAQQKQQWRLTRGCSPPTCARTQPPSCSWGQGRLPCSRLQSPCTPASASEQAPRGATCTGGACKDASAAQALALRLQLLSWSWLHADRPTVLDTGTLSGQCTLASQRPGPQAKRRLPISSPGGAWGICDASSHRTTTKAGRP